MQGRAAHPMLAAREQLPVLARETANNSISFAAPQVSIESGDVVVDGGGGNQVVLDAGFQHRLCVRIALDVSDGTHIPEINDEERRLTETPLKPLCAPHENRELMFRIVCLRRRLVQAQRQATHA